MRLLFFAAVLVPSLTLASDMSRANFICGGITDEHQQQQCLEKAKVLTDDSSAERTGHEKPTPISWIWPTAWWVAYYGFGLIVGGYIYRDAKNRGWLFLGIRPVWWLVLVLFEPAPGVLAYWATHYSKLAQTYSEATALTPKS